MLQINIINRMESEIRRAFMLVGRGSNDCLREGEQLLSRLKKDKQFPLTLLGFLNNTSVPGELQLLSSIQIRQWCEFFKNMQTFERNQYGDIIDPLKEGLVMGYFTSPLKISKTLRLGIMELVEVLFPDYWGNLMTSLVAWANQNTQSMAPVLKLMQNVTHKYSYLSRTDPLYDEINKVCDEVHDFLKDLTTAILERVLANPSNTHEVTLLTLLMKLFYNLNYQDLHPKYEDNLGHWMEILKRVMKLENTSEEVFKCKGAVLEVILLYANKYKEDVQSTIQGFCEEIWGLSSTASENPEFDPIVLNSLKFFKSLLSWHEMKEFFTQHMSSLMSSLIIPNIRINKVAVGVFEDEPESFVDYYFRAAELNTRRSAALDLLRVICRSYQTFEPFIKEQIANFLGMNERAPQDECTILGLVIDGCSKGYRDVDGCTQLWVDVEVVNITYQNIVKPTLSRMYQAMLSNDTELIEKNFQPIHVATIVRFLFYYRLFVPNEQLSSVVQFLASIRTNSQSLPRVAWLCINGFIIMRHGDYNSYRNLEYFFTPDRTKEVAVSIFKVIYAGTCKYPALQETLTKMLFNVASRLQQLNCGFYEFEAEIVKEMLKRTEQYDFLSVQFLFEAVGVIAYQHIIHKSPNKAQFEGLMLEYFAVALKNKSDLLNFCLQILAIYLQLEGGSTNPQYLNIYQSLLIADNWSEDNQSIMSAYIQFIISFVKTHQQRLVDDKPALEVILSRIISIDHIELFYRFLEAIYMAISLAEFNHCGYMSVFVKGAQVIGATLAGRKATLLFVSKLLVNEDPVQVLPMINTQCPQFYEQLLDASSEIISTINQRADRKRVFISICNVIRSNYFQSAELEGSIINNLITNTVERFAMRHLLRSVKENESKEKKEGAYTKLRVFKEFEKTEKELDQDEEAYLVHSVRVAVEQRQQLIGLLTDKSKDRFRKLCEKYQ